MPISRVRSKIDMSIVLSMPTEPRNRATAAVVQAMARERRICVVALHVVARGGRGDAGNGRLDPLPQVGDRIVRPTPSPGSRSPVTCPSRPIIF